MPLHCSQEVTAACMHITAECSLPKDSQKPSILHWGMLTNAELESAQFDMADQQADSSLLSQSQWRTKLHAEQ